MTKEKYGETTSIQPGPIKESEAKKHEEWEQFFYVSHGNNNIEFRHEDKSKLCRNDDGFSKRLNQDRLRTLVYLMNGIYKKTLYHSPEINRRRENSMKTIAIDITNTVFNNDTAAMMYVTRDIYEEPVQYIFAIPVITFSWSAKNKQELETFFPFNVFGDKEKEKRLLVEMKRAIDTFED